MSTRWMDWEPKGAILTDIPRLEPTKPTKPGFDGSCLGGFPKIATQQSPEPPSLSVDDADRARQGARQG